MLTRDAVMDLLIKYDSEHPATLGEMADRRAIYVQRIVDLADPTEPLPTKIVKLVGNGRDRIHRVDHPFGRSDIIVSAYDVETNNQIIEANYVREDGYILINFGTLVIREDGAHFEDVVARADGVRVVIMS